MPNKATALTITYPAGTSTADYDKVISELGFEDTHDTEGALFHWAEDRDGQLIVHDVWESREAFDQFVTTTLAPISERTGMPGPENIEETPVYNFLVG